MGKVVDVVVCSVSGRSEHAEVSLGIDAYCIERVFVFFKV